MNKKDSKTPLRSLDLEIWRTRNGLTISAACELLGLQRAKWTDLQKSPSEPIDDMAVCMLVLFYEEHPETMPISRVVNIKADMEHLGYDPDEPSHKKEYALLHGREPAATYRWLNNQGTVGKPVERLMEAANRLSTESGNKKRNSLRKVADEVAERMGISDPFKRGTWRKD